MTALPVPEDGPGEFGDFALSSSQGIEAKSPGLVLSGAERTREALLAAAIAVEFIRVVVQSGSAAPSESSIAARYTSRVVDNSRALCGGNSRLHLSLLVSHRDWMRGLPTGSGELHW